MPRRGYQLYVRQDSTDPDTVVAGERRGRQLASERYGVSHSTGGSGLAPVERWVKTPAHLAMQKH
jgi:hypothetical protein